ncbi:MAG: hypothetical protein WB866_09440, partial [Solirubrobacterales bacterium]
MSDAEMLTRKGGRRDQEATRRDLAGAARDRAAEERDRELTRLDGSLRGPAEFERLLAETK